MNVATEAVQTTLANALSDPKATGNEQSGAATASTASNPSTPPKISATLSEAASGSASPQASDPAPDPSTTSTKPKSRNKYPPTFKSAPTLSHKSKSTLVSLGVAEPYFTIKSTRRSRRPFTSVEDEALIKGYTVHGFQWTQIQQDKELNLSHRKATDLRDRFRTKFPDIYKEGGIPPPPKPRPETERKNKEAEKTSRNGRATGGSSSTTATRSNSDSGTRPNQQNQPSSAPNGSERRKSTTTDYPIETTLPILRSILPPPDPPNTATSSLFQFSDEGTGAGAGSNVDSLTWGDGSLPPLIWDEIA